MVRDIAIYIEGGGNANATKSNLREGFSEFLADTRELARKNGIGWKLVLCGGRREAYDDFVDAVTNDPDIFNVLLVDSEEPVAFATSPWSHLKNRRGDYWHSPRGLNDDRCHMMVVCMEAWFLADPKGLKSYFGKGFNAANLPNPQHIETLTKEQINDVLQHATRETSARKYEKIRDGSRLLKKVDARQVRTNCKWCDRLFKTIESAIHPSP